MASRVGEDSASTADSRDDGGATATGEMDRGWRCRARGKAGRSGRWRQQLLLTRRNASLAAQRIARRLRCTGVTGARALLAHLLASAHRRTGAVLVTHTGPAVCCARPVRRRTDTEAACV